MKDDKTTDKQNQESEDEDEITPEQRKRMESLALKIKQKSEESKNRKPDGTPTEILQNELYLGSLEAAKNKEKLLELKITHILVAASMLKCLYPSEFKYYQLTSLEDTPNADIKRFFRDTSKFIEDVIDNGGRVYVHCHQGVSRSASVVIAFLMEFRGFSFDEAMTYVKARRPIVKPNDGFVKQLKEYEEELNERILKSFKGFR